MGIQILIRPIMRNRLQLSMEEGTLQQLESVPNSIQALRLKTLRLDLVTLTATSTMLVEESRARSRSHLQRLVRNLEARGPLKEDF